MSQLYDITPEALIRAGYRPIHAGDDYSHKFIAKENASAIDLTSAKIWFTIKERSADTDAEAKLQYASSGSEVELTDPTNGKFTVHLKGSGTADLEGTWLYDIKAKLSSGKLVRLARGVIEFLPNITEASS